MIGFKFIVLLYDDCLLLIKLRQVDNNGVKGFFFFRKKKFLKKKKKITSRILWPLWGSHVILL